MTKPIDVENNPWPTEIRLRRADAVLEIDFEDGTGIALDAEYLRVESPSAEVQGHGGATRPAPVPDKHEVKIVDIVPVGNYAVRLKFDDGHDTGLYSWDYLLKLSREREQIWPAYLKRLEEHGLRRSP